MNKQEIEAKLHNYEERLKDVAKAIKETREQLDEKPKLRHGDFGYSDEPIYPRIVLDDNKLATGIHVIDDNKADRPTVIFGNIFDLMKDWGEDLTEFKTGCTTDDKLEFYLIAELEGGKGSDYRIGTQANTIIISAKQVEKYWRKLGQLVITLKRKENSCS